MGWGSSSPSTVLVLVLKASTGVGRQSFHERLSGVVQVEVFSLCAECFVPWRVHEKMVLQRVFIYVLVNPGAVLHLRVYLYTCTDDVLVSIMSCLCILSLACGMGIVPIWRISQEFSVHDYVCVMWQGNVGLCE
jgi:hypothetical protein